MKLAAVVRLGVATCAALASWSCASNNLLTRSWADPGTAGHHYEKLVVVGVTADATTRRNYEAAFVEELKVRSVPCTPSSGVAPHTPLDLAAMNEEIRRAGADAVLVTRLMDQKMVNAYYPPDRPALGPPVAYHGGWHGYYRLGFATPSAGAQAAQAARDTSFRLEACLFDTRNDNLLWSALTQTTLGRSDASAAEVRALVATLVVDMERYGLVPRLPKPPR